MRLTVTADFSLFVKCFKTYFFLLSVVSVHCIHTFKMQHFHGVLLIKLTSYYCSVNTRPTTAAIATINIVVLVIFLLN